MHLLVQTFGLFLLSISTISAFAEEPDEELLRLERTLEKRVTINVDWLQHYAALLPAIDRTKGSNDNAFAEDTSDPYTQEKSSSISLVAEGSDYELIFSCDFTNKQVSVVAIGTNLQAMKSAEIGLMPNPITSVTRDTFNPDFYKARGDWAVATKRVIPNGDHGIVSGQWGGKYVNACRDNGEFRGANAIYCTRSNTSTLSDKYDRATLSSLDAPSQLFDLRTWTDFETIKLSLLNGTDYLFTQDIYPNREPFKSFFGSCSPSDAKMFGDGFYRGAIIFRPELAEVYRDGAQEAGAFFRRELLETDEFSKLTGSPN